MSARAYRRTNSSSVTSPVTSVSPVQSLSHSSNSSHLVAQTVALYKAGDGLGVAFVAAHQHHPHRLTEPGPGLPVDLQQPESVGLGVRAQLGLMAAQPAYTQNS